MTRRLLVVDGREIETMGFNHVACGTRCPGWSSPRSSKCERFAANPEFHALGDGSYFERLPECIEAEREQRALDLGREKP